MLDDSGPLFYYSKRLGKNGKPFLMIKYRTMKINSPDLRNPDGTTFSSPSDSRLTKIGKFLRETSVDEIPQVLNVLMLKMSFVGPRPDPLEWYNISNEEVKKKYSVRPGITGYTQAYFRNTLSLEEKNKNEVYYSKNVSFQLDLRIIFATVKRVFSKGNVYRNPDTINNEKDNEL